MTDVSKPKKGQTWTSAESAIRSLHHVAFRCFDAEETRRYYEEFLGFEFCAALPSEVDLGGKKVECLQVLFRMENGDFFSFYDVPDDLRPEIFEPVSPLDAHFAMKVPSEAEWETWVARLTKAGIKYLGPLDHDFVRSVYFTDPNGVWLEITYQVPDHEKILAGEKSHAKQTIDGWSVKTAERKAKFKSVKATA